MTQKKQPDPLTSDTKTNRAQDKNSVPNSIQNSTKKSTENAAPKSAARRTLHIARKALGWLGVAIVVFIAVLVVVVAVQMFRGQQPSLFGHRFYYILTDSMSPELEAGDVILSKTLTEEEVLNNIKVGDTVTFVASTGALSGKPNTHRVIKAPYWDAELGKFMLQTQGTKQGAPEDAPVAISDVKAVMVARSQLMTGLYGLIRVPAGYVLLLLLPVVAVIVVLILRLVYHAKKQNLREQAEQKDAKLKALQQQAVREYLEGKAETPQQKPKEDLAEHLEEDVEL